MRLLLICSDVPSRHPVWSHGGSLISWELIEHLGQDIEIDVLAFASTPEPIPEPVRQRARRLVVLPLRGGRLGLASLASGTTRAAWRRSGPEAHRRAAELSATADVTMLHGAQLLPLVVSVSGPLIVNEIDPWSSHLEQEAAAASGARRAWLRLGLRQTLRAERLAAERADDIVLVGARDGEAHAARLGRTVAVVPNGVTAVAAAVVTEREAGASPTMGFVGSLDYPPNVEVVRRLREVVLPQVRRAIPDARLVIAGRKPPPELVEATARDPHVLLLANFASIEEVYGQVDVAVFPSQRGFGVRNSLLDALSCGRPVVAARSAARSLPASPALTVVEESGDVPSDDRTLATAVAELLADPERRQSVASTIPGLLDELPTWQQAVRAYEALLREAHEPSQEAGVQVRRAAHLLPTLREHLGQDWTANRAGKEWQVTLVMFRFAQWVRFRPVPLPAARVVDIAYRSYSRLVMSADLPSDVTAGPGLRVRHGYALVVQNGSQLGRNVLLRHATTIGYDSRAPARVGDNVQIGCHTYVVGGITVSDGAYIGAGSVVTRSVAAGTTVAGNPARPISSSTSPTRPSAPPYTAQER